MHDVGKAFDVSRRTELGDIVIASVAGSGIVPYHEDGLDTIIKGVFKSPDAEIPSTTSRIYFSP